MPNLSILLLGDTDRTEFREAEACLQRCGSVHHFSSTATASTALAEGQLVADAIVLAQAFPGQFSHQAVDRLRRLAPLARVLGLMGSWCEGEMRTGSPWPGAVRTYWHQWPARCERELQRLAQGHGSSWALPVTATEEERLLADTTVAWPRRQGLIVIHSRCAEVHDWLSAACRSRGYSTVWQRPPDLTRIEGAAAALFDGSDLSGEEADRLRRLTAALRPAPVIALLNFPRIEDCNHAIAAGATVVLSKPLAVDDLFWELESRVQSPESRVESQANNR